MANKYIALITGLLKEVEALVISGGVGDAGKITALDGTGKLDITVMPSGVGAATKTLTTSEAISAGDLVNVWNDSGTLKARKADATSSAKKADGFVLAGYGSGVSATVYLEGIITGLTVANGPRMWLSNVTPGAMTGTAPTFLTTEICQEVAVRLSGTEVKFEPQLAIEVA